MIINLIKLPGVREGKHIHLDPIETIQANSFKDFHAKGLDYLCLYRRPEYTLKMYTFEGDVSKAPEVVNPHDHRYSFTTMCIAGRVANSLFRLAGKGDTYQQFDYHTKLNGGNGFTWKQEVTLRESRRDFYFKGESWASDYRDIHTLRICEDRTILLLEQYEDLVATDIPTTTFTLDKEPPSLSGLYSVFTEDEIIQKLKPLVWSTLV